MGTMRSPDYVGGGLVNLVAEIEQRLGGGSVSPGLTPELAASIPNAETYVFVLFDGLGDLQIASHEAAADLKEHRVGALDAPFSTHTSVATATLATGLPPSRHGLVSYLMRLPQCDSPVSTLWWSDVDGTTVDIDLEGCLPATWLPIDEARHLWGPGPFHPELESRLPEGLIVADDNVALHYPGNQIHLVGYHGGLSEDELRIPLLVWDGDA